MALPGFGPPGTVPAPPVSAADTSDTRQVILNKAMEALRAQYEGQGYRFRVSGRWIPGSLRRAPSEQIGEVEPAGPLRPYSRFDVWVQPAARGGRHRNPQRVQVQLKVEAERKLPVASRRLSKGTVIAPGDFSLQWIGQAPNRRNWVAEEASLVGKTLRRTLLAGQPVEQDQISGEYVIEAGEPVRLLFKQQGLAIELHGEARQSGARQEEITIYSTETRRKYLGRVTGPGIAVWTKTLY